MVNNIVAWENKLKEKGIRVTKQRLAILKVLLSGDRPITAQDIYHKLKKNISSLRLSTVYRNLNYFCKKNVLRKIELDYEHKESYFELIEGKHHHHLVCINCGEILALDCPLREYLEKISDNTDYKVLEHMIKIYGFCPECKEE